MNVDYTSIVAVLTWVMGFGAPFLVGKLFAYLAENWSKWHELPKEVKFIIPMIVSVLLALGAQALLGQPAFLEQLAPYWTAVAQAIIAYLGTQQGYMEAKRASYGRKAQL